MYKAKDIFGSKETKLMTSVWQGPGHLLRIGVGDRQGRRHQVPKSPMAQYNYKGEKHKIY